MKAFSKFKQLFQNVAGSHRDCRKPESVGYGVLSSDVYNCCTQARKQQADGCLSGRSMVEMIGVLAIIGVLSVGAIAGYSAAMNKYRMNKTIDIVNHAVQSILELSGKNFDYINTKQQLHQLGIVSEEQCPSSYMSKVNPYSTTDFAYCPTPTGELNLYVDAINGKSNPLRMYAEIIVYFLGSISERKNNCINFLSYRWEKVLPPEWWLPDGTIEVMGGGGGREIFRPALQEITLNDIEQACDRACNFTESINPDEVPHCFILMRPKA